ncbi:hypothetical protein M9Y10_015771 [Tritrichomonas musculus]|uniref:DUF3447 domain-containing protein n=1 Tax=Tritrichomonas musculus TaxID=1915356 RepID=A0ABR2I4T4_9EUKA
MSEPILTHDNQQSSIEENENSDVTAEIDDDISKNDDNSNQKDQSSEIEDFINDKKELYNILMIFLENTENDEDNFQNLININHHQNLEGNRGKFEDFLILIKLYQIIQHYEDKIKQTFSKYEIFNIFGNNKKILLFLFQKEIIKIDESIVNCLLSKNDSNGNRYCHFFYPQIKKFISEEKVKNIEEELISKDSNVFDRFEEKQNEGENDSFICSLMRSDSVEQFIEYVNRTNISLRSELMPSIFETNSFLIENKSTTLIEYSVFFGAIQIFQYLKLNNIELEPSLWLYAIHSRNAEIIHLLEQAQTDQTNENYIEYFCESIKCHHNEIAEYIENNLITENEDKTRKNDEVIKSILNIITMPICHLIMKETMYFII